MWLSVLSLAASLLAAPAAAIPMVAPVELAKVAEWANSNRLGKYMWFDDRLFLLEMIWRRAEAGEPAGSCATVTIDAETKERREQTFPLGAWAREHAELFYGGKPTVVAQTGREIWAVDCSDVLHIDRKSGVASLLVSNFNGFLDARRRRAHFLVRWPGGEATKIDETNDGAGLRSVVWSDDRWYFEETSKVDGKPLTVLAAIEHATQKRVEIWRSSEARGGTWWPAGDRKRFVFVEYSEKSAPLSPPARLFVIDAQTGESFSMPTPVTSYGIAFLPDGKSLLVGSNELGTIERFDLEKRSSTLLAKGLRGLQHIEVAPSGKSVLVMRRGAVISRFAIDPWKALPDLPVSKFLPGKTRYSWDWSRFSPDGRRLLLSWNKTEGTVDFLEMDQPGVGLYEVRD